MEHKKMKTTVLIDNGHGVETAGKRSPDGRLREYAYAREIAVRLEQELVSRGIKAYRLVPEENDVPLSERVKRANKYGIDNVVLVSIHCNAAGNGTSWLPARGWAVYVDPTASKESKRLATALANTAEDYGLNVRKEMEGSNYWVQNLYICKHTLCPAVLTENLFQDNKEDVDYLLSEKGKQTIVNLHVEGIIKYIERYGKG